MQERRNSIAKALELHISCTNPLIYSKSQKICIQSEVCCILYWIYSSWFYSYFLRLHHLHRVNHEKHNKNMSIFYETFYKAPLTEWKHLSHKSHNAPDPYPTMHHSEQKYPHFCSEWCIVGYGTGPLWDLWDWSIENFIMAHMRHSKIVEGQIFESIFIPLVPNCACFLLDVNNG